MQAEEHNDFALLRSIVSKIELHYSSIQADTTPQSEVKTTLAKLEERMKSVELKLDRVLHLLETGTEPNSRHVGDIGESPMKGKRSAENEIEKAVSAKKQRVERDETVVADYSDLHSNPKDKSVVQEQPATVTVSKKTISGGSSSESDTDDDGIDLDMVDADKSAGSTYQKTEDEKKAAAQPKKAQGKPTQSKAPKDSPSSEEGDIDEEEEEKEMAATQPKKAQGKPTQSNAPKHSSSSEESDSSEENTSKAIPSTSSTPSKGNDESSASDSYASVCRPGSDEEPKAKKLKPQTTATPKAKESKTLSVTNISTLVKDIEMRELFKNAVDVRLSKTIEGLCMGYGLVEFATAEAAKQAMELDGVELWGRPLCLKLVPERILAPQSRENKGGRAQTQTTYVKGFDTNLKEDEEEKKEKAATQPKKAQEKPTQSNAPKHSSSSEESDSDKEEEEKEKAATQPKKAQGKPTQSNAPKHSSSSEESDSSEENTTKAIPTAPSKGNDESSASDSNESAPSKGNDESSASDYNELEGSPSSDEEPKAKKLIKPHTTATPEAKESKTLSVTNLSYLVKEPEVRAFFKNVVDVRLSTSDDDWCTGSGHVEFATTEAAKQAMELNGQHFFRQPVRLELVPERALAPQSRENNSFQKGRRAQTQTIYVKGFDTNLKEDEEKKKEKAATQPKKAQEKPTHSNAPKHSSSSEESDSDKENTTKAIPSTSSTSSKGNDESSASDSYASVSSPGSDEEPKANKLKDKSVVKEQPVTVTVSKKMIIADSSSESDTDDDEGG